VSLISHLDDATFMRTFHGWATVQWSFHLPAVVLLYFAWPGIWEKISILYLALVSIYANIVRHWSTWQAARAEIKADGK
jgi:hypothetical protein